MHSKLSYLKYQGVFKFLSYLLYGCFIQSRIKKKSHTFPLVVCLVSVFQSREVPSFPIVSYY